VDFFIGDEMIIDDPNETWALFVDLLNTLILALEPEQLAYISELHNLYRQSNASEREEIKNAIREILLPDGVGKEGDVNAGVSEATKQRVDNYYRRIGMQICKRRIKKGFTQTELARKAGIPQSHLSRLESGKHTPTHVTIKKLAKALKCQLENMIQNE
jgi:ribosome-binding protein aMBF1 (putative translation factor)